MCLLSQLLSKVTVTSCSFYVKCSMCPPALLLDDALKNVLLHMSRLVLNCCFLDTDSQQGTVARHLRRGGIFSDSIISIFLPILIVKTCENWSIFDEVIQGIENVPILGPPVDWNSLWQTNKINRIKTAYRTHSHTHTSCGFGLSIDLRMPQLVVISVVTGGGANGGNCPPPNRRQGQSLD